VRSTEQPTASLPGRGYRHTCATPPLSRGLELLIPHRKNTWVSEVDRKHKVRYEHATHFLLYLNWLFFKHFQPHSITFLFQCTTSSPHATCCRINAKRYAQRTAEWHMNDCHMSMCVPRDTHSHAHKQTESDCKTAWLNTGLELSVC